MRVAFYAPMKAPDHPVPSGDRTMARELLAALAFGGHEVWQPSRLRTFLPTPDTARQEGIAGEARLERDRIARAWAMSGAPDAWFTYHNHHKAPDLLGPELSRRYALPYAIAEASHAGRRAAEWSSWHAAAAGAIRAADLHLCFTDRDRSGIMPLLKAGASVVDLPPFLDARDLPAATFVNRADDGPTRLVTVAMMRPGDKLASYGLLAEALGHLADLPWHLDIVGDGPARPAVEACFAALPAERITWHGTLERAAGWRATAQADIFAWPGFGEAFGLAYLEAQAAGVPVVALDIAGVGAVVRHGDTGLLADQPSAPAYAALLRALITDRATRIRMGEAAARFVREERTLVRAATILDDALRAIRHREIAAHG